MGGASEHRQPRRRLSFARQLNPMLHYHVWFNLKPGISENEGLANLGSFFREARAEGAIRNYQLLKNEGGPPRSKLARFHALVEFEDQGHLTASMQRQAAMGIHKGLHGAVVGVVQDFHVEVFSTVDGLLACEI